MKRLVSLVSKIMILIVALTIGVTTISAASALPDAVTSDTLREVEYIKNFPVIVKSTDNGKYYVYCLNIDKTYASNVVFKKTGVVDDGFAYILKHKPNTGNKDKDFYITQMAVWYYQDYLNQNNHNLESIVKKYIIAHKDTEEVSKAINNLLEGAKAYKKNHYSYVINTNDVKFTIKDGYFVSEEIKIEDVTVNKKLSYSLTNAPIGSKVIKSENGVVVLVPEGEIPEGKQLTVKLHISGSAYNSKAYYYSNSSKYQDVLFQDTLDVNATVTDTVPMVAGKKKESFEVEISKTDITQNKLIEGASLVVKSESGAIIDAWKSTSTSHYLTLKTGVYTLAETVAPEGYKLSKTTIYFQVNSDGSVSVKNNEGVYVAVNRVVMINELIDVVSFAKKDIDTDKYLADATLVIKDTNKNVVKEFISTNTVYQLALNEGEYTLSEIKAPKGYNLSAEVVSFKVMSDGTLKVKNSKGEYVDSAMVIFYNKAKKAASNIDNNDKTTDTVKVPATGKESYVALISGLALLTSGAYFAKKTIKGC